MDTGTLDFTRSIAAPPARVFALMTDSDLRQNWNSPGDGFTVTVTHPATAAPGARETAMVTGNDEPDTTVHTDWTTVTPDMLAYAETLEVDGMVLASSFMAATLEEDGAGTKLTLHVALVSYTGPETLQGYRMGCDAAFTALAACT